MKNRRKSGFFILAIFSATLSGLPSKAQEEGGIRFVHGLEWQQLLARARAENKFIFVDCYATWCGPCKLMDKEVYPKPAVGDFMNAHFISIKEQLDTAVNDNAEIRRLYADARSIRQQYSVTAMPTYLFFTPEGKLVHRGVGAIRDSDFVKLAANSLDPHKQYYTLLANYREGNKDVAEMPYLISKSASIGDKATAAAIAKDYLENYLYRRPERELLTKENIELIRTYTKSSAEKGFRLFYRYPKEIDSAMHMQDYARGFVDYIIAIEDIEPRLWKDDRHKVSASDKPDWKEIGSAIRQKYNRDYEERTILDAKIRWYFNRKDWKTFCGCYVEKAKKYGPFGMFGTDFKWNEMAWDMFNHCDDKKRLTLALEWSDSAIKASAKPNAEYFDTKANLLYKIGRSKEATVLEEKAAALNPQAKDIAENLAKMKKGEPTWPQNQ